jgi:hypothetical protein
MVALILAGLHHRQIRPPGAALTVFTRGIPKQGEGPGAGPAWALRPASRAPTAAKVGETRWMAEAP